MHVHCGITSTSSCVHAKEIPSPKVCFDSDLNTISTQCNYRNGSRTSDKLLQQSIETAIDEPAEGGFKERVIEGLEGRDQHLFEFDDEPVVKKETGDKMEFVQYPRSPNAKCT